MSPAEKRERNRLRAGANEAPEFDRPSSGSHVGFSIVSDEDYIALLIGRIVMSWGLIDESIWSEIVRFELHKRPGIFPHELKIAGSWGCPDHC